jgi:hypothetical protein
VQLCSGIWFSSSTTATDGRMRLCQCMYIMLLQPASETVMCTEPSFGRQKLTRQHVLACWLRPLLNSQLPRPAKPAACY